MSHTVRENIGEDDSAIIVRTLPVSSENLAGHSTLDSPAWTVIKPGIKVFLTTVGDPSPDYAAYVTSTL